MAIAVSPLPYTGDCTFAPSVNPPTACTYSFCNSTFLSQLPNRNKSAQKSTAFNHYRLQHPREQQAELQELDAEPVKFEGRLHKASSGGTALVSNIRICDRQLLTHFTVVLTLTRRCFILTLTYILALGPT